MEYRDLYDENRKPLGRTIAKNQPVPSGCYYIVVVVFIENSKGELLLQKRSEEKGGKWATTGGHPKTGESSEIGMQTELKEELGLEVELKELKYFKTIKSEDDFVDLYYLKKDVDIKYIKMQPSEVQAVKWYTKKEIKNLISSGKFFKYHIDYYKYFLSFIEENA